MTSSVFARRAVLCWGLAAAIPAVVFAQVAPPPCAPSAAEFVPTGPLTGDQSHPALSIASDGRGAYLTYEDPILGIGAVGLDANFSRVSAPFRINKTALNNQLRPQVALLPNGGEAVFVWQAGPQGFQHIYARFLSATNSWLTQDAPVNTFNLNSQTEPAIAALANGNVIIVWNSLNQFGAGSLLDVYGQVFSPAGQKIGGEVLINQFTSYNQRNPAVAALTNGGFAVTWVSEQQPSQLPVVPPTGLLVTLDTVPRPRVDVYARLFAADGAPAGNEFPVNTGTDACANPRIAAGSDGGLLFVWSQKNTANVSSSWDIFSRPFSSDGSGGTVRTVNTHLYGDQYAPQISALATNYLAVWTSLGQDGSREGVYGQFLAGDGSLEGGEFRVNTTTLGSQMQPCVASDSVGRFLVVWTGYVLGHANFDLFGQRYAVPNFVPPAIIAGFGPPFDFSVGNPLGSGSANPTGGSSSGSSSSAALPAPVSTVFAAGGTNSILAAGAYAGLFYDTNKLTVSSSGYFAATVNARRTYSAKIVLGNRTYSFQGIFNASGLATYVIRRGTSPALTVSLQLDLANGDQICGSISGGFSASIFAVHQVFNKSTATVAQPGAYTLVIPADEFSANSPPGDGYGAVKVDALGKVTFSGALADGTVISQSSTISKQGVWPLYCSLYGGSGSLIGWIQFASQPDSDLGGQIVWTKPGGLAATYRKSYSVGFTNNVLASGSAYSPPTPSNPRLLNLGDGNLIFYRGGLTRALTNSLNLDLRNRVTSPVAQKLKLSFTLSSGLLKGTTLNPETGKTFSFQGALLQKNNLGVGFFLGTSEGGGFYLSPAP